LTRGAIMAFEMIEKDTQGQRNPQETFEEIFGDLDRKRQDFIERHGTGPEDFVPFRYIPAKDRFFKRTHKFTLGDEALIFLHFVLRATPEERQKTKKELEILLVNEDPHLVQPLLRILNAVRDKEEG